jgi:multidrug efflux system outer membrane protein
MKKIILLLLLITTSCSLISKQKSDKKNAEFSQKLGNNFFSILTSEQKKSTIAQIKDDWWQDFNDEKLNKLIELAIENNTDLKMMNQSIVVSRQLNNIDASVIFPSGSVNFIRQRFSQVGFGPSGLSYDLYQSTIDAAWELDFLGKNLDRYKASKIRFLEDLQLYKYNHLRLAAEVSINYFSYFNSQKQIDNLAKIYHKKNQILQIAKSEKSIGVIEKSDLLDIEIEINSIKSNIVAEENKQKLILYKLAFLTAKLPEEVLQIVQNIDSKNIFKYRDYSNNFALRSEILKNRPDVVVAEMEIDATDFEQKAQFKEFFPSFNLTARIGGGSNDISQVLKDASNIKDIRGGFSLPIFSYSSLIAKYKISKSKAKTAILNYENVVLKAVEDVESSIDSYFAKQKIYKNSYQNYLHQQEINHINQQKFKVGRISSKRYLQSEINLIKFESEAISKKAESLISLISMHKAVGGGFSSYQVNFEKNQANLVKKSF